MVDKASTPLSRAYFGMQCFWGVESSFARLDGVLRTRVGYAGGEKPAPTYAKIGDHTEVVELEFDPAISKYGDLLDWFFGHHNPTLHYKKQYQSAILYVDEGQRAEAEGAIEKQKKIYGRPVETYVKQLDKFYQAEDYHQKYWLRCQSTIHRALGLSDAELISSPLAAKVNAFLAGYDNFEVLQRLAKEYELKEGLVAVIRSIAETGGDPRACH